LLLNGQDSRPALAEHEGTFAMSNGGLHCDRLIVHGC
jgi:hypothetical protein